MCARVGFRDEQQLFSSPFFLRVLWFGLGFIYNMSHVEIQQALSRGHVASYQFTYSLLIISLGCFKFSFFPPIMI